jgi:hypothetical protein
VLRHRAHQEGWRVISERRRSTRIILPVIARPLVTTLATGAVIARLVLTRILLARTVLSSPFL